MVNITAIVNNTDIVGMGMGINQESNGMFGLTLLIVIYAITFITTIRYGSRMAFYTAAYIGAVAALFLRILRWMNNDALLFMAIALAALAAVMAMKSRYSEG